MPKPRSKPTPEKLTYTPAEAAAVLGVSRPTMYDFLHSEGFPALRVGRRWLISRELLAEWVKNQARKKD